jgi:hypothetical protein
MLAPLGSVAGREAPGCTVAKPLSASAGTGGILLAHAPGGVGTMQGTDIMADDPTLARDGNGGALTSLGVLPGVGMQGG